MSDETKKVVETSLATLGDELEVKKRRLALEKVKAERKKAIRIRRDEEIKHRLSGVLLNAVKNVNLRQHAFKSDEELAALKLRPHEIALVRQWQEAKRNAAYALESSSKQIEAHLRTQADKPKTTINVENMTVVQLPEKQAETEQPLVIDVSVEQK